MAKRSKNAKELGKYKAIIHRALFKSQEIKDFLLGDTSKKSMIEIRKEFKEKVKSHLFIDDTVTDAGVYIYYDVIMPKAYDNIKNCRIIMYVICHRQQIDDYTSDTYEGNTVDILSQIIEDKLINDEKTVNSFGIGELSLDSIDIYNATRFYGRILTFNVPAFR